MALLIGAGIVYFIMRIFIGNSLPVFKQSIASKKWPSTTAKIIHNEVTVGKDGLYSLNFKAEFKAEGESYVMDMPYLESGDRTRWKRTKSKFVQKNPVGSEMKVYYNPENPKETTIEPGFRASYWQLPVVLLIFFLIGLLLIELAGIGITDFFENARRR